MRYTKWVALISIPVMFLFIKYLNYTIPCHINDDQAISSKEDDDFSYTLSFNRDSSVITIIEKSKKNITYNLQRISQNKCYQFTCIDFNGDKIYSETDWIAPFVVGESNRTKVGKVFTGGCHSLNGEKSAIETLDQLIVSKDSVALELTNLVMANNSIDSNYSLKENISMLFKDGKVYVTNRIEALKDVDIDLYYGLQTSSFGSWYYYITNDGFDKQRGNYNYNINYKPSQIIAIAYNKHKVISEITSCSLTSDPSIYALHADYSNPFSFIKNKPNSGNKGYFVLINKNNVTHLDKGETIVWDGFYEFM